MQSSSEIVVVPNLHPSAVIRNRKQWEPLFKKAFESVKAVLNEGSLNTDKVIQLTTESFYATLEVLAKEYNLVDVQRYKDIVGDQIVDQGIFYILKHKETQQHKYLIANDVKYRFAYIQSGSQSPRPFLKENEVKWAYGCTCKELLINRWKFLEFRKDRIYYDYDFSIDDWLVYQFKNLNSESPDYTIAFFDIEVHSEDNLFPNERDASYPISTLSIVINDNFYQIINKELFPKPLDEKKVYDYIKQNNVEPFTINFIYVDNEVNLLMEFAKLLEKYDVDVLTAWNIYFDVNYIANRSKRIGFDTRLLSPIRKPMYPSSKFGYFMIPGIIVIDQLETFKSYEGSQPSYSLDYITHKYLGVSKVKYTGTLGELLHNDPELYIAYSAVDTYLIKALENTTGDITLHLSIKDLSWVSFLNSTSTLSQIDGLMYQYAKKDGLVIRQRPKESNKDAPFVGAFVREPRKGYIPWVIDLDASSMYPSIMISLNISPETFVAYIENSVADVTDILLSDEYDDKQLRVVINPSTDAFEPKQVVTMTAKQLKEWVRKNNLTISFSGAIFDKNQIAFIPKILDTLIKERKVYKEKAKELLTSKDPKDIQLGKKYNVIQKTLKVLANSIYGATGNQAYRFFDTRISTTITLTGQFEIKFVSGLVERLMEKLVSGEINSYKEYQFQLTRDILEQASGEQYYVFYSDTDSSFIDIFDLLCKRISERLKRV